MNVWITSCKGFLGRAVAEECMRRGDRVIRTDVNYLTTPDVGGLLPEKIDLVVHTASVCRWHPKESQARFMQNKDILAAVLSSLGKREMPILLPLPMGALDPWNTYSQAMANLAKSVYGDSRVQLVFLPTLYGLGDPHHAKVVPSFLMATAGRGEQSMVVYGDGRAVRHYMHVEEAAKRLVHGPVDVCTACTLGQHEFCGPGPCPCIRCSEGEGWAAVRGALMTIPGELFSVANLAEEMIPLCEKVLAKKVDVESRPWQFRADGLGSPTPDWIGPKEGAKTGIGLIQWAAQQMALAAERKQQEALRNV